MAAVADFVLLVTRVGHDGRYYLRTAGELAPMAEVIGAPLRGLSMLVVIISANLARIRAGAIGMCRLIYLLHVVVGAVSKLPVAYGIVFPALGIGMLVHFFTTGEEDRG